MVEEVVVGVPVGVALFTAVGCNTTVNDTLVRPLTAALSLLERASERALLGIELFLSLGLENFPFLLLLPLFLILPSCARTSSRERSTLQTPTTDYFLPTAIFFS